MEFYIDLEGSFPLIRNAPMSYWLHKAILVATFLDQREYVLDCVS